MGRGDLIGNGERHLVPRLDATPGMAAVERRRETPGPGKLAKKFGQARPRPGAAVERRPATVAGRGAKRGGGRQA